MIRQALDSLCNFRRLRAKGLGFIAAARTAQLHFFVEAVTIAAALLAVTLAFALPAQEARAVELKVGVAKGLVANLEQVVIACLNNQPIWVDDELYSCQAQPTTLKRKDFDDHH